MGSAERIIIANDNAPLVDTAARHQPVSPRKDRRRPSFTSAHDFKPGQMQWHPQNPTHYPSPEIFKTDIQTSNIQNSSSLVPSLNRWHRFILTLFAVLMLASIASLFFGLSAELCGRLSAATSGVAVLALSLPKAYKRQREFLSLSAWITGMIALNFFFTLNTIEILTVSSLSGYSLTLMSRLAAPAVAGTLTLACLVAIILPQTGLI